MLQKYIWWTSLKQYYFNFYLLLLYDKLTPFAKKFVYICLYVFSMFMYTLVM